MSALVTVRFTDDAHYDINRDADVLRLYAITNIGTFHAVTDYGRTSNVRAKREAFKQYVLSALSLGQPPCEVNLG